LFLYRLFHITQLQVTQFHISKFKKTKNKIWVTTLWNKRLIFLCSNENAESYECGVRIMLGNNTGRFAVMLRRIICICIGFSISTRIFYAKYTVSYIYTQFLFAQNSICALLSGTKIFRNSWNGCAVVLTKRERHCYMLSHLSWFDRNSSISSG
jgi:hypothetical protein